MRHSQVLPPPGQFSLVGCEATSRERPMHTEVKSHHRYPALEMLVNQQSSHKLLPPPKKKKERKSLLKSSEHNIMPTKYHFVQGNCI